jgi:hypothetical protein
MKDVSSSFFRFFRVFRGFYFSISLDSRCRTHFGRDSGGVSIRELRRFAERLAFERQTNEAGGEGVARTNGISHRNRNAGQIDLFVFCLDETAVFAAREAGQFQGITRTNFRERCRRRDARQTEKVRKNVQFLDIQFQPIAEPQRFVDPGAVEEMLAKIDVEHPQCLRGFQRPPNGCTGNRMALGERAETDHPCIREHIGESWIPFEKIVSDIFRDPVSRFAAQIEIDFNGAGRMCGIDLDEFGRQIERMQFLPQRQPEFARSNAADGSAGVSKLVTMKRKVTRRSAKSRPGGQKIPQQLADAEDSRGVAHRRILHVASNRVQSLRRNMMESLKIVLLCVATAILYGICHDQVTARICVEYFTIGHPPIFGGTQDPTLLAFGWGVFATWWVGVMLGVPAAILARIGSRPKLGWRDLVRSLVVFMTLAGFLALIAGIAGFVAAKLGAVWLVGDLAKLVPEERQVVFLADLWSHTASYAAGFVGGALIWGWIWWRRGRKYRQSLQAELETLRREKAEWINRRTD